MSHVLKQIVQTQMKTSHEEANDAQMDLSHEEWMELMGDLEQELVNEAAMVYERECEEGERRNREELEYYANMMM